MRLGALVGGHYQYDNLDRIRHTVPPIYKPKHYKSKAYKVGTNKALKVFE